jgi:hypothetical protein
VGTGKGVSHLYKILYFLGFLLYAQSTQPGPLYSRFTPSIMVFKSFFVVAACVAAMVGCAPTKLEDRQDSAGVPDYVLKYGK